jgi:glucose-6-phosphate 1-epimerase
MHSNAITLGQFGQLPAVHIASADGARATVTLFGAQLVSWTTAAGAEQLFCSARSALDGSRAIRGGVPLIFPQFNERGPIMRHGFARTSTWRLVDSGEDDDGSFAVFALAAADLAPAPAAAWPHAFCLQLRVALRGAQLALTLEVNNTGAAPFDFSVALHSYLKVADVDAVRIDGVRADTLRIGEALDAIYGGVGDVAVADGARVLHSAQSGFVDAVVWNPGQAASAAMADLAADDYRHFVCVEPALIAPFTLAAGARWRGYNRLAVSAV